MKITVLAGFGLLFLPALLPGQNVPGSLTGVISYPDGAPVANAPIQLKGKATGAVARAVSRPDGNYSFDKLAAGVYDFSLVMPCCAYARVAKEITIEAGNAARFNVSLIETINGSTLGDDPARLADVMRKRAKVPARPAPRTASGRPDLSGVWLERDDPYPEDPVLTAFGAAKRQQVLNDPKAPPHHRCLPGPPPMPGSAAPFISKLVQTPSLLVLLFEDYPGFRQIFLDGRSHPALWEPTWMGHSIGQWERDVLVVDTVGFNDRSLLGGIGGGNFPHSEALHMIERYRRTDFGHMEVNVTFDDPNAFARPYHENLTLSLAPQEELLEYVCENNKSEHYVK